MYERFYNLRERPFSLTPDPDYLFLSRVHREGLNHLRYGVESHAGFVVITGEIGCGKTTLLQTVIRGLDQQTAISRIVNTALDSRELIEAVMLDFGLNPPHGQSKPFLLRDLARFLVDQRNAGRHVLLVIDEAQNLTEQALEEVRMLSNLETEKSKLIQIVLIGQPDLRDLLARPTLEQFRQRITVSYHLQPMDREETAAYINHRLRRAAIWIPLTFPSEVTDLIYRYSRGVARKVNIIADAVLLFGYGANKTAIDVELTQEVLDELGCKDGDDAPLGEEAALAAAESIQRREEESPRVESNEVPAFMQASAVAAEPEPEREPEPEPEPMVSVAREIPPPPVQSPPPALVLRPPVVERPNPITLPARESRPLVLPIRPPANGTSPFAASSYRVLSEHQAAHRDGMWRRMWRGLIGTPKPVFED
ncbi:MAG TPA: XrtA/PEP-CTERM system-associated ATPase [Vicinamibacterales bacterium]|nr:XrtA/PEP-CTERM system-associated ATPase [Vicinamibacterales bacterium]